MALPSSIQQIGNNIPVMTFSDGSMKIRPVFRKKSLTYNGGYYIIQLQGLYYSPNNTKLNCTMNYDMVCSPTEGGTFLANYNYATTDNDFVTFYSVSQQQYNSPSDEDWTDFPINDFSPATKFITDLNSTLNIELGSTITIKELGTETIKDEQISTGGTTVKTFPALPYIQNPISVYPENIAINGAVTGSEEQEFSFQFMGQKLMGYYINFYNDNNELFFNTDLERLNSPIYNGQFFSTKISTLNITDPEGATPLFSWEVVMYDKWDTNAETTKLNCLPFHSLRYFCEIYTPPTLRLYLNGNEITNSSITLQTKNINLVGNYSQPNNIPLKWYEIILTKDGHIIKQTDKIFSENITFDYDGFLTGENYKLSVIVENLKQQQIQKEISIEVNYTPQYSAFQTASCKTDNYLQKIELSWEKESTSIGKPENVVREYEDSFVQPSESTETNRSIVLTSPLYYDSNNDTPLIITRNDFGIAFRTTINQDTRDILEVTTEKHGVEYRLYMTDDYVIYFDVEGQELQKVTDVFSIDKFGVQQSEEPESGVRYMWYVDEDHSWTKEETDYYVINGEFEFTYLFYIYTDNNIMKCNFSLVTDEEV